MARASIRRSFLVTSIASTLLALVLFAAGSFAIVMIDDAEIDIDEGDSFRGEVAELILGAMVVAAPLALVAAGVTAVLLSRRTAKPVEDAIRAARETTAHDLRRNLPVPPRDDELRDLVVSLNELFVRLDDGFGALARFAADASHELRTPLAVIATELEVALRHPRDVAEWEATGRNSLDELRRLSALVEGLLTLARADADAPASRTSVRIVECVDAVVAQLAETAELAGVALAGPDDETDDRVLGNAVMIETALRNLIVNAITYTPRGGEIRVRFEDRAANDPVAILVDDNGPGLGANPEALFLPFRRGTSQAATTVRHAGVGLGLAIARRIAVAHGGALVGGKSPLGGARFTLAIPRTTRSPPSSSSLHP